MLELMTKTSLVIVMATIMVVGVLGTNLVSDADALKSKNGASKSTDICGSMLCSDYPGDKEAFDANWSEAFFSSPRTVTNANSNDHSDSHSTSKIVPSSHNADQEFPAQLDAFIHKFELDKISADEALEGIKEIHDAYVKARINTNIIDGVGEKFSLYKKGIFDASTAVEAIHLTAEPQNVDPEYQGALDEVIHKFELDKISADEALEGIKEAHYGFVDLYITSDIIEAVEGKIALIDSGKLSGAEAVEAIHLTAEPQNVDPELASALDEVIHKFELDKISADEAMNGITDVYDGFVELTIISDIIEDVGEKIALYNSGKLEAADAVEAVHLTAEPQNVDPEFINAVEEYTYQLELNGISLNEAFEGITDVYDGFVGLTITSELIEDVGTQLAVYDSGRVSMEFTLEEIEEIIEEAERVAQESYSEGGIPEMKDLPPNTVDIPVGTGVPGCEVDDWCYMPSSLTAHVGDTITWINSDTLPHTVTSGNADVDIVGLDVPNGFDSGFMSADDRFEHTFGVAGFYDYYCQLHPWMIGSITVE